MENDYKKELEKDKQEEKNPYQAQFEAQQAQIIQLQAQLDSQNQNPFSGSNAYAGNSTYARNSNDPYAKFGNKNKQAQRAKSAEHIEQAVGIGIVGSAALGVSNTAALGAVVAKGAAVAGFGSVAAVGSLPVAGALLLGGGAAVAGAIATVIAGKAIYKGVKALTGLLKGNQSSIFPSPRRSVNAVNLFQQLQQKGNKADGYIKDAKKDFVNKKDISTQTKDLANLKGLSSKQKKEVGNLYADNQIRKSAQANGGTVNEFNIKKQVLADAKEQGWSQNKTKQMLASTKNRVKVQKKNHNITAKGKVMSVNAQDLKKPNTQTKSQAKAVNNIQRQTAKMGKSIKSANNSSYKAPVKQAQKSAVKRPQLESSSKDNGRGR